MCYLVPEFLCRSDGLRLDSHVVPILRGSSDVSPAADKESMFCGVSNVVVVCYINNAEKAIQGVYKAGNSGIIHENRLTHQLHAAAARYQSKTCQLPTATSRLQSQTRQIIPAATRFCLEMHQLPPPAAARFQIANVIFPQKFQKLYLDGKN